MCASLFACQGPFGDQLQKATAQQQTMTPLEVCLSEYSVAQGRVRIRFDFQVDAADLNNIAPLQQYEQHEKKFTMDDNKEPTPEVRERMSRVRQLWS